jgi:Protein of unknown function (DUF3048) N-terminal domain/Protein of unknown function (DUF3048) C-terminal domain
MTSFRTTPRRRTRWVALAVALLGGATAVGCSSTDDGVDAGSDPAFITIAPTTTQSTTTTVKATTTTEAPTTTIAATTTTEPGPPVYPLTGLLVTDPVVAARPALVVKIDNASGARPQTGFNSADIVVEEIVNDNLTRFAMIFQSQNSDPVGPIRSGRLQDIDLFGSLHHPLFAWSGGNRTVTDAIRASDLVDLGPTQAKVYFRSNDRRVPHNLYSNTTALWTQAPPDAAPPDQQFEYRDADEPPAGVPALGVGISLDSIDAQWDWDGSTGLYRRTMEGRTHNDAAGGQVTTNNVLVLEMEYLPGISGSPDAQTIGTGEAFVFTGGNYVHGTWTRTDRLAPFALVADDGSPIELMPGRSFIELPRDGHTLPIPA